DGFGAQRAPAGARHADGADDERRPHGLPQDSTMSFDPTKKLRVLVLCQPGLIPPETLEGYTEAQILNWKTEYDVITPLRAMRHEVFPVEVSSELAVIHVAI